MVKTIRIWPIGAQWFIGQKSSAMNPNLCACLESCFSPQSFANKRMRECSSFKLLLLLICLTGIAGLNAQTILLDYKLTIQPIYMNNGSYTAVLGNSSYAANIQLFQDATQMIWAQAGVRVNWLAAKVWNSSPYYNNVTSDATLTNLLLDTTNNLSSTNPYVMNMWFMGPEGGVLGFSSQTVSTWTAITGSFKNGVTISETVFSGMHIDTIAHEIGHNLALLHQGADGSTLLPITSLMYPNATGVTSLLSITPLGSYDTLSSAEISKIRSIYGLNDAAGFNFALLQQNVAGDYYTYPSVPEPQHTVFISGLLVAVYVTCRQLKKLCF